LPKQNHKPVIFIALPQVAAPVKLNGDIRLCVFYHPLLHRKTRRSIIYCRKTA